jgi:hypothetical protein
MKNPLCQKFFQNILNKDSEESKLKDIIYFFLYMKVEKHQ